MFKRRFLAGLVFSSVLVLSFSILLSGGRNANAAADSASSWGFDLSSLDRTCKPCDDFYQLAMGSWMKNNPIPADYSNWGTFTQLADRNQQSLRAILENAAANKAAAAGSSEQKIGDFYASCMNTDAIDAQGLKPLAAEFARMDAMSNGAAILQEIAHLQNEGVRVPFRFESDQDFKDSTQVIGEINQAGLGMPDRDYYLRDDDKSKQLREAYEKHVVKMFTLAGDAPEKAAFEAKTVLALESALAKASMTRVQLRDPDIQYHKMSLVQLQQLAPHTNWKDYFAAAGRPGLAELNVSQPDFLKEVDNQLAAAPLDDWKTYLRWHLLHGAADALPGAFVQENFEFNGKLLTGAKELQPRWKRCVRATDRNLGEALGQIYVQKYFPQQAKARTLEMVHNLLAALRDDLPTLSWMSAETRKAAAAKLEAFAVKIGYPDKWRDYSALQVDRNSYAANFLRGARFETARDLAKIGKPVDRGEWGMSPPTVNAYNNSQLNEIVFPAGILQPPFYDPQADDSVNYGGMGAVIGHEITHGFDDQGAKFDAQGNLKNWWTDQDIKNFQERGDCVAKQFDGYEVEKGLHQNGKLVEGESIADLGGLTIAYAAYEKSLAGKPRPKDVDGFTPEQRFFLGWAQVWGANLRPEFARLLTNTNPHPLPRFRGIAPLSNMAEFARAFGCKKGDAMVREQVCKIW